ncbi:MAG: MoaD/ThiS family protein [Candidatus Verstraetearchaeota archaeon]|nr:MoaD/ThiS family protein [Candidatus Verstraetearchaeota archaeon]
MVKVEVRLFANLREAAGTEVLFLEFTKPPTIADVLNEVVASTPALKRFLLTKGRFNERYKVLVGAEIVFPENFSRVLKEGRLAILPPVSGG